MNHLPLSLALHALGIVACGLSLKTLHTRRLKEERRAWRRSLALRLGEAATPTAEVSEAAAAALAVVAEFIRGTGELGFLESRVLLERVLAGARLDDKRAREALLLRMATMLHGVAGARELIRVMLPETRRDTSLRDDALSTLDAAVAAYRGEPACPTHTLQSPNGGPAS
jgi:hypothetical protein